MNHRIFTYKIFQFITKCLLPWSNAERWLDQPIKSIAAAADLQGLAGFQICQKHQSRLRLGRGPLVVQLDNTGNPFKEDWTHACAENNDFPHPFWRYSLKCPQ